ncbi:hypothetical protein AMTRI_Chr11g156830 [Amborella trichopoda]
MIILLCSCPDGIPWKFTAVYGPNSASLRHRLWSELDQVAAIPHPIWALGGDFNVTRWPYERKSSTSISQDMRDFSEFINRQELLDSPLQGCRYTWSNHASEPSLSKLDRFLLSLNWEESFLTSSAIALPNPTSDHCPILLDTMAVRRGPKPFRFELAWLQESSLSTLIPTWCNSFSSQVRGRAGYRLQTKIQLLNASLKTWSRSTPCNYSLIKSSLLESIQQLNHLEECKPLNTTEKDLRTQSKMEYLSILKKEEIY